jgi:endonuclease/exonuclease/phosphatase family metal-dependent hydrolase
MFKLDRVWVRPTSALAGFRVHLNPVTRRASDHLPVTASIRLTPDGAARATPSIRPVPVRT